MLVSFKSKATYWNTTKISNIFYKSLSFYFMNNKQMSIACMLILIFIILQWVHILEIVFIDNNVKKQFQKFSAQSFLKNVPINELLNECFHFVSSQKTFLTTCFENIVLLETLSAYKSI